MSIAQRKVRSRSTNDKSIHAIPSLRRSISAISTLKSNASSSNFTRPDRDGKSLTQIKYFTESMENLYIFVMDSLREDFTPKRLSKKGIQFSTISQSLFTAPSFASICTGRYPQEHGVYDWYHSINQNVQSILNLQNFSDGFFDVSDPNSGAIYSVLGTSKTKLSEMEPPFIHVERDLTPHLPFDGHDSVSSYFKEHKNDWDVIKKHYRKAIGRSVDKLETRLDTLAQKGILDSTLVVVTSDHGDLFGEYGCVAHSAPMVPELVRVPAIFINPSLSEGEFNVEEGVIEHTDMVETAINAIGANMQTSGVDLTTKDRERDWGYTYVNISRRGRELYEANGIWWPQGGYSITENSSIDRMLYSLYRIGFSSEKIPVRRSMFRHINHILKDSHSFGSPPISEEHAKKIGNSFIESLSDVEVEEEQLSSDTKKHLEDLGYMQ